MGTAHILLMDKLKQKLNKWPTVTLLVIGGAGIWFEVPLLSKALSLSAWVAQQPPELSRPYTGPGVGTVVLVYCNEIKWPCPVFKICTL